MKMAAGGAERAYGQEYYEGAFVAVLFVSGVSFIISQKEYIITCREPPFSV